FTADVRDVVGAAGDVQRVQLRFSYLDQSLGRGTRIAEQQGPGVYRVDSSDLSAAGRWQVDVVVRRLNREDTTAAFLVDVGVPSGPNNGSAIPLPVFRGGLAVWGLALFLLATLALLWAWFS